MKKYLVLTSAFFCATASAQVAGYKTSVSIALPAITTKPMGATFDVPMVASSGAAATLTSTTLTKCTVSSETVTPVDTGACVLLAKTRSSAAYSAGQTPLSIAITPAVLPPPVVTAGHDHGTYPWATWTPAIPAVATSVTGKTYYVDATGGADVNAGTAALPFKTITKALTALAAGDTVLIKKGLYRESVNLLSANVPTGTAVKPITIGSFGDGEVIVDGSTKVNGWTLVGGTVWRATVGFVPIGVVVNDVPLRQVTQGQAGSTAPQVGLAGVTSGSGKWHNGGTVITADMGTTIGSGNPNQADIVVPNNIGDQSHVYFYYHRYIKFIGLTVRGSGSNGIWGYGSNITIESCNIKFNGKSAISFQPDGSGDHLNADNSVITTHAYHNVLLNWPRGNNFFAESGGGWAGGIAWSGALRPVARGNIAHMNGGEGIITYGTFAGKQSGSAIFEQNVAYDNWSVNMYFDNQANNIARNNILYNHPPDNANYLYVGTSYPWDRIQKFSICFSLSDEQNSSDGTNNSANLANSQVYNNLMIGCRIGIMEYAEGAQTLQYHGLKNTTIKNNTIVMPSYVFPNYTSTGILLRDNKVGSAGGVQRNTNTIIQNNIIYGYNNDALIFSQAPTGTALEGINLNYNLYYSASAAPFGTGFNTVNFYNLANWRNAVPGSEVNSLFIDPQLLDVNYFRSAVAGAYDWRKAMPANAAAPAAGYGAKF